MKLGTTTGAFLNGSNAVTTGVTNPYFATGAGGILQSVIMGFGGVDISYNGGLTQVHSVFFQYINYFNGKIKYVLN